MEYENINSLNHTKLLSLKTLTQFLVSISVFSLIYYSHCSSWCYFLLHSFKLHLSAIPLHTLDKGWIFLLCNGILVVIANTSDLVCSPSGFDPNALMQHEIEDTLNTAAEMKAEAPPLSEEAVLLLENENDEETKEEEEEEEKEGGGDIDEEEAEEIQTHIPEANDEKQEPGCEFMELEGRGEDETEAEEIPMEDDQQENEKNSESDFLWEEVQVEEEHMEKMSAEELNKKFEDFIRKMKEELRIEAQQHLVVVK